MASLLELLKSELGASVLETHAQYGDETAVIAPEAWLAAARLLRDSPKASMEMLVDLTCVDYPDRNPRFEVVVHLLSLSKGHRLRIKCRVGDEDGDDAKIDSLTELWGSANWSEREAFDMFGVQFVGLPDLRRILMYPEFVGHPLRKDYPANKIQPLVPYREEPGLEKLPPFRADEGMPFGRQSFDRVGEDEQPLVATDQERMR
ncbi:MAG TPA: NADH-quinone oxidoreductase subunit C [Polyangiaceae bacterium]|nr:NADH-quinone oxidoreductase subunit C [Polyangiaceae bacterium]